MVFQLSSFDVNSIGISRLFVLNLLLVEYTYMVGFDCNLILVFVWTIVACEMFMFWFIDFVGVCLAVCEFVFCCLDCWIDFVRRY